MASWFITIFGTGMSQLLGFVFLGLAILLLARCTRRRWRLIGTVLPVLSVILFLFSGIALTWQVYLTCWATGLCWYVSEHVMRNRIHLLRRLLRGVVLVIVIALFAHEMSYQFPPKLPADSYVRITVLGDSVSAGIGGVDEKPWPSLFAENHAIEVNNLAVAGARVKDALSRQLPKLSNDPGLMILEIGGNDLLSPRISASFESDFKSLVDQVCQKSRAVVMFELPTLPGRGDFVLIQRQLAQAHQNCYLIPRRYFVRVITTPGSTSDGVHLTQAGHQQMARTVSDLLKHAMK